MSVSRRSVARAVAWAVPVVTLANASPALAASGTPEPGIPFTDSTQTFTTENGTFTATAYVHLVNSGTAAIPVGGVIKVNIATYPNPGKIVTGFGAAVDASSATQKLDTSLRKTVISPYTIVSEVPPGGLSLPITITPGVHAAASLTVWWYPYGLDGEYLTASAPIVVEKVA